MVFERGMVTDRGPEPGSKQREIDVRALVWAAVILTLLSAAGWYASQRYRDDRIELARTDARRQAEQYAAGLHTAVTSRGALAEGLATFVADRESSGTLTAETFGTFAAGQYSFGAGTRTIQVAPGGVIRWTYPLAGNSQAIGLDILNHADPAIRADVRRAWDSGRLTVSAPFELAQGGLGLALRQSVIVRGERWGVAAVIMDIPPLLADAGLDEASPRYRFAVEDSRGRIFAGDTGITGASPVRVATELPEGAWTVLLAPRGSWDAVAAGDVMGFRLAALAIAGLVSLSAYLLISRQRRLTQLVELRTADLAESERRARAFFDRSPVSLWQEDFSALKRRVDEIRASGVTDLAAHLREHPDVLNDLIALIEIKDVNVATLGLYEVETKRELFEGLGKYSTPESREVFIAEMVAVADGRTEFWGDSAMRNPSGAVKHVALRWTVMPGSEDDFRSVIVSVIDLTDRVVAQRELDAIRENLEEQVETRTAELIHVNQQLIEAQRAKDAFLANMSHELRTPLNSVLGFTGVMLQEIPGPLNEEQRRQLEMVRRSGRQLLALVNDVLDLAKVETGHAGIEITGVDVAELATGVADIARPIVEDRGLRFDVDLPATAATIRTDRDRVSQVLLNLLTNAAKFTRSGSVVLRLTAEPAGVVFTVSDTGPGVPPDHRETIFQPFFQMPTTITAKATGSGLGLAIARDLAGLLGGTLTVRDNEGGGAVFEFRLPARLPEDLGA